MSFVPKSCAFRGSITLGVKPSESFSLFSPLGEMQWVPGWEPDLLYPRCDDWAEGQLFRTREEFGDALWIVSKLDEENRNVLYYRVEPGRYVAKIDISVRPTDGAHSRIIVVYSFVGLSEGGNTEIEEMSQRAYDEKMKRWSGWLETCLGKMGIAGGR